MVTASEGSPTRVTSQPFSSPPAAPANRQMGTISSNAKPACQSEPASALDSPSIDATERSTCPATTSRVIGRAISAISETSPSAAERLSVLANPSVLPLPARKTAISRMPTVVSQRRYFVSAVIVGSSS